MDWHFRFPNPFDTATELAACAIGFYLLWHGFFVTAVLVQLIPFLIILLFRHPRIDALCDTLIGRYTARLWDGHLQLTLYNVALFNLAMGAMKHWTYVAYVGLAILALFLLLPLWRGRDPACGDAGASA